MKFYCALILAAAVMVAAQNAPSGNPNAVVAGSASWSYTSNGTDWGGTCQSGKHQSPIDIAAHQTVCVREGESSAQPYRINYHYKLAQNLSMAFNGYSLQVAGDLGFVTIGGCNPCDGLEYDFKQFHFHAPAEHTIDGKRYPMELHLVHQKKGSSDLQDLLFISIFFYVQPDGGFPNSFLENIDWNHAPSDASKPNSINGYVDLHRLKESFRGEYWTYDGSLTTPSCDETVKWFIMKRPLGVTADQLSKIQTLFQNNPSFANGNGNNRATQPINDRKVTWFRKRL